MGARGRGEDPLGTSLRSQLGLCFAGGTRLCFSRGGDGSRAGSVASAGVFVLMWNRDAAGMGTGPGFSPTLHRHSLAQLTLPQFPQPVD